MVRLGNMPELREQTVIVTGASGGLGKAVTETFLNRGATVVGAALGWPGGPPRRERFQALEADLTSAEGSRSVMDAAAQIGGRVDCLAHVVGGFAMGETVAESTDETWDRMISVNLRTTLCMIRTVIPAMQKAGWGRVIVVGSKAGVEPAARMGAYCASKAALHATVQVLAAEVRDSGITANAVLPSVIDTPVNREAMPQADWSRWVKPEAIAELIVWLASDAAADVNGALIPVHGRV